jgi:hypothetical protein
MSSNPGSGLTATTIGLRSVSQSATPNYVYARRDEQPHPFRVLRCLNWSTATSRSPLRLGQQHSLVARQGRIGELSLSLMRQPHHTSKPQSPNPSKSHQILKFFAMVGIDSGRMALGISNQPSTSRWKVRIDPSLRKVS